MDEQIHTKQFKGYSLGAHLATPAPIVAVEAEPRQGGVSAAVKFVNVERVPGGRDLAEAALNTVGLLMRNFAGKEDIWPLRDAGLQGRWFHVIEDRTGMLSLREALELHGPIDAPSCVERAGALARVLTSLHSLGAVCGFLNPDNVFLNDDGSFVLGDFLTPAFVYVYHREAGRPIGLVNCMAPELLRGEANDPRADVFALAALIYRAVTGRSPFTLEAGQGPPWDVRGVPVDAGLYGQGCNRHFSQVLRWALAPDPDHRPPSPHRLIMDLRATFLDPGDVQSAPEPAARGRGRKTRRAPGESVPESTLDTAALVPAESPDWFMPELGGAPARPARRVPWAGVLLLALVALGGAAAAYWWLVLRVPETAAAVTRCPQSMVRIAAGPYTLGEDDRPNGVRPSHTQSLAAFCIDRHEYPNKPERPVESGVSWDRANRVCLKQGLRLCTEKEWEAACRGDQGRVFPYGSDFSPNICNTGGKGKTAAGWLPGCAGPSGALDMAGNLMEWTADRFGGPQGPFALRGGSWKSGDAARCSSRFNPQDVDSAEIGFRCCVDLEE